MKKTLVIWLSATTLLMACNSFAQTAADSSRPDSFTLAISADHRTAKAGAKVVVHIAITNTSDKPIALHAEIEDYGFMVDVTAVGHGTALDTDRGREWKKNGGMRGVTSGPGFLLNPGETTNGPLVISDLYDLSRPGKYSVQVSRGAVKSNAITLTVVP